MAGASEMVLTYFQKGFNYSQDGPGNRLVYHLNGCNLRCPWCSNPEGMAPDSKGRTEDVKALASAMISAGPMYFEGGGVTLTGGECTLQFDPLKTLLILLREAGVDTCIETNASHPRLPELFPYLNTLIADFKHPDPELHRQWTGADNLPVIRNLRAAAASDLPLQLRVPLIHGVNDDDAALAGFIAFFKEINRPGLTVEFLRYHEYGREKWEKQGLAYTMKDAFVSPERAAFFEGACKEAGLHVIRT